MLRIRSKKVKTNKTLEDNTVLSKKKPMCTVTLITHFIDIILILLFLWNKYSSYSNLLRDATEGGNISQRFRGGVAHPKLDLMSKLDKTKPKAYANYKCNNKSLLQILHQILNDLTTVVCSAYNIFMPVKNIARLKENSSNNRRTWLKKLISTIRFGKHATT